MKNTIVITMITLTDYNKTNSCITEELVFSERSPTGELCEACLCD